jgi:hypothetical protein
MSARARTDGGPKTILKVFVASPGDVRKEREALVKVISELNLTLTVLAPERRLALELIRWETHVAPGLGDDAQDVVNRDLPEYDVFVGIMWQRFGTPTKRADSGSHEEFLQAYQKWKRSRELPVLFYFCQKPIPVPRTVEEVRQLEKVVAFHDELSAKGLVGEYDDPDSFADVVRPHLLLALRRHLWMKGEAGDMTRLAPPAVLPNALETAKQDLLALAREYERVRDEMPWGRDRTKKMAAIFAKMRAMAASTHPLLPSLVASDSPGERLAAVGILIELPRLDYVEWLARRPGLEKAFVGYHATLALLQAVRDFGREAPDKLKAALDTALSGAKAQAEPDPNQLRTIKNALAELNQREGEVPP